MLVRTGDRETALFQKTRQGPHTGSTDGDQMDAVNLFWPFGQIGIAHIQPFPLTGSGVIAGIDIEFYQTTP